MKVWLPREGLIFFFFFFFLAGLVDMGVTSPLVSTASKSSFGTYIS